MATSHDRLLPVVPPNLPVAVAEYNPQYQDQLNNVFRLYFNRLSSTLNSVIGNEGGQFLSFPYGAFLDTTTHTAAATNTAYPITYNTTVSTNSVVLDTVDKSKIYVDENGLYNFMFSLQLDSSSGAAQNIWVWPRVNGIDVPDSATRVAIQGSSAELVAAWNFFQEMNAGDYFQLMWAVDNTGVQIIHEAATAFCPAIPSIIMTVNFVSTLPIA